MRKLTLYLDGNEAEQSPASVFEIRTMSTGAPRIVLSVPNGQADLFRRLAELLPPPFYVLYVLHTPRGEGEAGRYQSTELSLHELSDLLSRYASFFSSDGRHDLWVYSRSSGRTLVWDRHNLLFAEGQPLDDVRETLVGLGFKEGRVEPDAPWPPTPGGAATGPFYLVWLNPAASGILQEQWPYAVVRLQLADAPAARWPHIAVGDDAPAELRRGQELTISQCMACHQLDGAGDAKVGPDLIRPHSPTEYLQRWALRALIRDPASVRTWPDRRMPAFSKEVLSDGDIEAIAAYLGYLTERRK